MCGMTIILFSILVLSTHITTFSSSSDLVHRQTACWTVKHMALGVFGFGCEDALTHLMNLVWPNIFETSPHMVQSFNDAADGLRVSVGPMKVFHYTVQVCFNARVRVCECVYYFLVDMQSPINYICSHYMHCN